MAQWTPGWRTLPLLLVFCITPFLCVAASENATFQDSSIFTTEIESTTSPVTTSVPTTMDPGQRCAQYNGQCSSCVDDSSCFYCMKDNNCTHISMGSWTDPLYVNKCGSLADMRWKTCNVNLQIVIICLGVVAGLVVLGITVCCCCWRCKQRRKKQLREERKWEQQMQERKAQSEERKKERQSKLDEIRRKYGLRKDNEYSRFDD